MPVAKSYTRAQWDELVRSLESLPVKPEAEQRVSITDAMIKYALYPSKKDKPARQVLKESGRGNAASSPRVNSVSKNNVPRAEAVRENQKQDGGKPVSGPGSMVMRDAFSFEIRPDTENL